jgi:hypothetical protein
VGRFLLVRVVCPGIGFAAQVATSRINAQLSDVADALDTLNNRNR